MDSVNQKELLLTPDEIEELKNKFDSVDTSSIRSLAKWFYENKLLTVKELSAIMGISEFTVREIKKECKLGNITYAECGNDIIKRYYVRARGGRPFKQFPEINVPKDWDKDSSWVLEYKDLGVYRISVIAGCNRSKVERLLKKGMSKEEWDKYAEKRRPFRKPIKEVDVPSDWDKDPKWVVKYRHLGIYRLAEITGADREKIELLIRKGMDDEEWIKYKINRGIYRKNIPKITIPPDWENNLQWVKEQIENGISINFLSQILKCSRDKISRLYKASCDRDDIQ